MWRLLPLVLLLAWPAEAGRSCVSLDTYDAAVAAASKTTRAHFDDALAKRKLKPQQLPLAEWRPGSRRVGHDDNVVEQREYHGKKAAYLLVGTADCAPEVDLVRDGNKIFRVGRDSQPGKVTTMTVCSCGPNVHAGPCEGGMERPEQLRGYELPAGTTFGGVLAVEYVEDRVDATFTGGPCESPK